MNVGEYTYGNPTIKWSNTAYYQCGKFCSIGTNVQIYLGGGTHNTSYVTTYPFGHINKHVFNSYNGYDIVTKGNVIIENDVWLADNVTIMSGVTIGNGAVVANNSHVVKNVEPYTMVGGNPAKLIRHRFTKEQIEQLLLIKWWDWDDDKINKNIYLLCNDNIDEFIKIHRVSNN